MGGQPLQGELGLGSHRRHPVPVRRWIRASARSHDPPSHLLGLPDSRRRRGGPAAMTRLPLAALLLLVAPALAAAGEMLYDVKLDSTNEMRKLFGSYGSGTGRSIILEVR